MGAKSLVEDVDGAADDDYSYDGDDEIDSKGIFAHREVLSASL